jgi:hypothetical protein
VCEYSRVGRDGKDGETAGNPRNRSSLPVVGSNAREEIEVVVTDSRRQRRNLTKTLKRRDSMSRMHQVRRSEKGKCPGAQYNRDGGNAREMYKLACDPREEGKKGSFWIQS